jgi:hypothetical protein
MSWNVDRMLTPWAADGGRDLAEEQSVTQDWNRGVAEQAGIDPEYVGRLLELGLLGSAQGEATAGAVRRVHMIVSLEHAGIALTDLASAVNDGVLSFAFLDLPVFDRSAGTDGPGVDARTAVRPSRLLHI